MMKNTTFIVALGLLLFLAGAGVSRATVDYYIKIGDIKGESISKSGEVGDTFTLDASDIGYDKTDIYVWKQVSGPAYSVYSTQKGLRSSFIPTTPGTYVFELIATDSLGVSSVKNRIEIFAQEATDTPQQSDSVSTQADISGSIPGDSTTSTDIELNEIDYQGTQETNFGVLLDSGSSDCNDGADCVDSDIQQDVPPSAQSAGKWKVYAPLPGIAIGYIDPDSDDDTLKVNHELSHVIQQKGSVSVKAVEVRGWDPKTKEEVRAHVAEREGDGNTDGRDWLVRQRTGGATASDFGMFVALQALDNESITDITVNEEGVKILHQTTLSLFGFIPIKATVSVLGDGSGSITQTYPWWSFLARKSTDDQKYRDITLNIASRIATEKRE